MALLGSPLHPFFVVGCDSEWQDTWNITHISLIGLCSGVVGGILVHCEDGM